MQKIEGKIAKITPSNPQTRDYLGFIFFSPNFLLAKQFRLCYYESKLERGSTGCLAYRTPQFAGVFRVRSERERIMMATNEFTRRLPIEMLCLTLLRERDMYCYEMVQALTTRSEGKIALAEAGLYIMMYKLLKKGYVSDNHVVLETDGMGRSRSRVYYHLEESGAAYLEKLIEDYDRTTEGIRLFMTYDPNAPAPRKKPRKPRSVAKKPKTKTE